MTDTDTVVRHVGVIVVGSGFGGLGMAIKLKESGRGDFLVIERGSEVGGTWRDNTYPGAACDVPSHLYSFSFALNPGWTRSFSAQPEIQAYLRRTAEASGTLGNHLFDCELLGAHWDTPTRRWHVTTSRGDFTSDVLITAFGALCEPALPAIQGIESFEGTVIHSARWDHAEDLTGKRVAVIGTGASAIQLVPAIVDKVGHLDVYQRTAPWIMPRADRPYTKVERLAFAHVPGFQKLSRSLIYALREATAVGFCRRPGLLGLGEKRARQHLAKQVPDAALRAKITPDYRMGCKRVLISNDYLPALGREHVEVVTDAITEIRPGSVVTADGTVREIDVLILATGFHVTDSPAAELVKGADGATMADHAREHGMQAYKGTTLTGFPNMFSIVGPNTGLGHSSMVFMIESQLAYIVDALDTMQSRGIGVVDVKKSRQDSYNIDLQQRMQRTIWTRGGCSSWYLDAHGRNTTLWPDFTFTFRRITRRFDVDAYETQRASA